MVVVSVVRSQMVQQKVVVCGMGMPKVAYSVVLPGYYGKMSLFIQGVQGNESS